MLNFLECVSDYYPAFLQCVDSYFSGDSLESVIIHGEDSRVEYIRIPLIDCQYNFPILPFYVQYSACALLFQVESRICKRHSDQFSWRMVVAFLQ
jgi:hypothetical protein